MSGAAIAAIDTDVQRDLARRAVEAAVAAGASYAEARLVRQVGQTVQADRSSEGESHGICVRALAGGAWGFTASPSWTPSEAVALARDAVLQAKDNARWIATPVELAAVPVAKGAWATPCRIDPFTVPIQEKMDFVRSTFGRPVYRLADRRLQWMMKEVICNRTERVVATSEGADFVQQFYETVTDSVAEADFTEYEIVAGVPKYTGRTGQGNVAPSLAGVGWETVLDADVWSMGQRAAELAYERMLIPVKPVQLGRYTLVVDAATMGRLIDVTMGAAADIDRIIGIEANATGTSYLGRDPLALLGQYAFGNAAITVTATRASQVGAVTGLPTAKWDDEGVECQPFTLVQNGVLRDLPTTRAQASMLAPYYAKAGLPVASRGCAMSADAFSPPIVQSPTLVMAPSAHDTTFDDMIRGVPNGLALVGGSVSTDFQLRQLTVTGEFREIVAGRLGAFVANAAVLFDSAQLWKNLTIIGGARSQGASHGAWSKGQPAQVFSSCVVAVPGIFRDAAVVDVTRTV